MQMVAEPDYVRQQGRGRRIYPESSASGGLVESVWERI
jgi:hypothetical protein